MLSRALLRSSKGLSRVAPFAPFSRYLSTGGDAVAAAEKQAALERALNTSTAQAALGIAAFGALCWWTMVKYGDAQDEEEFESGVSLSAAAPSPNEFRGFKLKTIVNVNHDTNIYRLNLEKLSSKLELPVSCFFLVRAPIGEDGKFVVRPYTPISAPDVTGHFDLLIKTYPDGNVSKYMASLNPGDIVEVKGPLKKIQYAPNWKKNIGMIAGGTGITPMLQIIECGLREQDDNTVFHVLFANREEQDILLHSKLVRMAQMSPTRIKIHFVLEKAPDGWDGSTGYITADMIKEHIPGPSDDTMVFVCGPPPMMKAISGDKAEDKSQGEVSGILKSLGYTSDNVFKF